MIETQQVFAVQCDIEQGSLAFPEIAKKYNISLDAVDSIAQELLEQWAYEDRSVSEECYDPLDF